MDNILLEEVTKIMAEIKSNKSQSQTIVGSNMDQVTTEMTSIRKRQNMGKRKKSSILVPLLNQ